MATLKFTNKRIITASNYKELSATYLEQMAFGATMGFGKEYTTPEDFLAQCGDGDIEDGEVELWDVEDAKNPYKPLYDCWIYMYGDTANIFHTGTTKDTGVAMTQSNFEVLVSTAENEQLAKDLHKAHRQKD